MKKEFVLVFVLLFLGLICAREIPSETERVSSNNCPNYCRESIYYSNASYNERTGCNYERERCEFGCNSELQECKNSSEESSASPLEEKPKISLEEKKSLLLKQNLFKQKR
jgi:hypothetical protein